MINHPNRQTLYTVVRSSGEPEAEHCTVSEAAQVVLGYDGASYEIRRGDPKHDVDGEAQWELWSKRQNMKWVRTSSVKPEYAATEAQAWPLIAKEVLRVCNSWERLEVMRDDDFLMTRIFGRLNSDGNVAVLYVTDGSPVTRLPHTVYPIGSELSARYEHASGIVLSREDAASIGLEIE